MGDVQDLARRAAQWKDDAAQLDQIMTDMSALSEAHVVPIRDAAGELLTNARGGSNGGLNEYQSARCHVYVARGERTDYYEQVFYRIQQASDHLEKLREAFKPLTVLGLKEHPQIEQLAKEIAELHW